METVWQDLRYALRGLGRQPGFTLVAVFTLALGIAANTTIFSVIKAVLLRSLPYREPERLVRLWESNPGSGITESSASAPNFEDWRKQQSVYEQLAAYEFASFNFTGDGEPERVPAFRVTDNLFPTLGVLPAIGRNFLPDETQAGRDHVAILSDGLWQRRFGGDPSLIGRQIKLSDESYIVIGVMPPHFQLTRATDVWVPLMLDPSVQPWRADRTNHNLNVVGRLKSEISLVQAQAAMETLARQLEQQYPKSNAGWSVRTRTFYDWIVPEQIRRATLVLFAAVGFVLLIACANVANLLLARASTRQKEMAIRAALGASRARVLRQLLTESMVLALLGGLTGTLLALWATASLRTITALNIPRLSETRLDLSVFIFTSVTSLLTGLIFGLAPAWQATESGLHNTLKESARGVAGGVSRGLHGAIVIGEIGFALVLMVGAGLLLRSFAHLQNVPLGFEPNNVLTMQINLPGSKYGENSARVSFYSQLLERLRTVPGVLDAAAASQPPVAGSGGWTMDVTFEGREATNLRLSAATFAVTPHFFRTMGIPLLQGRDFSDQDRSDSPLTLIVNDAFARKFWPHENPIGKRFRPGTNDDYGTVVGVVGNVRNVSLEDEGTPAFYFAHGYIGMPALTVVVRTATPPETMTAAVRAQVSTLDRDLPIYNIRSMNQVVFNAAGQPRFQTVLLGLFSTIALLLAAVGIYSVMAYGVTQRTHEIGVRMALGAQTSDVLKLVIRQSMKLSSVGIIIGLGLAFGLTRFLRGLLYEVRPTDPLTFVGIPLLLLVVTLLAGYIPARRATKVDPMVALRE